jgi:serine protease SohB
VPDAVSRYLLFLAETVTMLVALAALLVFVAGLARRGRSRSRLKVENLNDRFEDLDLAMSAALQPGRAAKHRRREARARRKARQREAAPSQRPRVFVVDFAGDPRASGVDALREELTAILSIATATAAQPDEVLVRLKNPGGFVHDQGLAASQLLRVRTRGIRLVVAVDTVAASGGYLMAAVADRIVAAPFAVVGSIGVVTQVPNVHRLLERHGVDVEQFTGGRFKRTVTMLGPTTEEGREKLQEQIDEVHVLFKDWVARYRPQLDLEQVGTGEYWYGSRALELQLVDEVSTSDEYLLAAAARADVFRVSYTPQRGPGQRLGSALSAARARLLDRTA